MDNLRIHAGCAWCAQRICDAAGGEDFAEHLLVETLGFRTFTLVIRTTERRRMMNEAADELLAIAGIGLRMKNVCMPYFVRIRCRY